MKPATELRHAVRLRVALKACRHLLCLMFAMLALARQVLRDHPAVLNDPEPWVLVDGLGPSTVNLRAYFWLDGQQHSWLKVRSAIIRLTKGAFQAAGISLPDESREIVFPDGVPVRMLEPQAARHPEPRMTPHKTGGEARETQPVASTSEGGLTSEAGEIEEQARRARMPEAGESLIPAESPGNGNKPDAEP